MTFIRFELCQPETYIFIFMCGTGECDKSAFKRAQKRSDFLFRSIGVRMSMLGNEMANYYALNM